MSNDAQSIRISHKSQQKDDSGCCPPHLTRLVRRRVRRSVPKGNIASFKSLHTQINHRMSVTKYFFALNSKKKTKTRRETVHPPSSQQFSFVFRFSANSRWNFVCFVPSRHSSHHLAHHSRDRSKHSNFDELEVQCTFY